MAPTPQANRTHPPRPDLHVGMPTLILKTSITSNVTMPMASFQVFRLSVLPCRHTYNEPLGIQTSISLHLQRASKFLCGHPYNDLPGLHTSRPLCLYATTPAATLQHLRQTAGYGLWHARAVHSRSTPPLPPPLAYREAHPSAPPTPSANRTDPPA
jgi:hypothetical protein